MMSVEKTKRRILLLLFLIMLVAAVGSVLYIATEGGTLDMKQGAFASDIVYSKPLIDTQVAKKVATATFAMG
jgi:hypothetical protein